MKKAMAITIGYIEYAIPLDDVATLLEISLRAKPIKRVSGYSGPYMETDGDPFVTMAQIIDLEDKPDFTELPVPETEPFPPETPF